jgi:hypothetical protein
MNSGIPVYSIFTHTSDFVQNEAKNTNNRDIKKPGWEGMAHSIPLNLGCGNIQP